VRSHDLKRAKREVRKRVLALRDHLTEDEREAAGEGLARTVLAVPEVAAAGSVLAFWSFGSEIPLGTLMERLHAAGVVVHLPRIAGADLEVVPYAPGDEVRPTSFGAMEPVDDATVDPATLDAICTPAVAFDRDGRRVGYGGGFYDRLFPRAPGAFRLGVGYDLQVLDEALPAGHFDLRVHAIATPSGTLRCPPST
jgi:5-formyltetrahydrofolate cyclo-ligase